MQDVASFYFYHYGAKYTPSGSFLWRKLGLSASHLHIMFSILFCFHKPTISLTPIKLQPGLYSPLSGQDNFHNEFLLREYRYQNHAPAGIDPQTMLQRTAMILHDTSWYVYKHIGLHMHMQVWIPKVNVGEKGIILLYPSHCNKTVPYIKVLDTDELTRPCFISSC